MEDSVTDEGWRHQHVRCAAAAPPPPCPRGWAGVCSAVSVLPASVFCRVACDLGFFWSHPDMAHTSCEDGQPRASAGLSCSRLEEKIARLRHQGGNRAVLLLAVNDIGWNISICSNYHVCVWGRRSIQWTSSWRSDVFNQLCWKVGVYFQAHQGTISVYCVLRENLCTRSF